MILARLTNLRFISCLTSSIWTKCLERFELGTCTSQRIMSSDLFSRVTEHGDSRRVNRRWRTEQEGLTHILPLHRHCLFSIHLEGVDIPFLIAADPRCRLAVLFDLVGQVVHGCHWSCSWILEWHYWTRGRGQRPATVHAHGLPLRHPQQVATNQPATAKQRSAIRRRNQRYGAVIP